METELSKIDRYFDEVRKIAGSAPSKAFSKEFYELWEMVHKPESFFLDGDSATLFSRKIKFPPELRSPSCHFRWDPANKCPSLVLEGRGARKTILLRLGGDGSPEPLEDDLRLDEEQADSHGSRLEVFYDLIDHVRRTSPSKNVLALTKKDFLAALDAVHDKHNPQTVKGLRKLTAPLIRSMLKSAAGDMAADEVSAQLSLPLDGSYAMAGGDEEAGGGGEAAPESGVVHARTKWEVERELSMVSEVCRVSAECESDIQLFFKNTLFYTEKASGGETPLRMPDAPDCHLREGDSMPVFMRGETSPRGSFVVDMHEGGVIYGRMSWDGDGSPADVRGQLYARPSEPPVKYLAENFDSLVSRIMAGRLDKDSVLNEILGLRDVSFPACRAGGDKSASELDPSQKEAWALAVSAERKVALIHGPPGTGKTAVLERVLRTLCGRGLRILVTAPSNTAVDNICRRCPDLPLLRFGGIRENIAPDVADKFWIGEIRNVRRFAELRAETRSGGVYAGTHVGIMKDPLVNEDLDRNGLFDAIIFDEAGMARPEEFFLCASMGRAAVVFGDHQQLPPFPYPAEALRRIRERGRVFTSSMLTLLNESALEWMVRERGFHSIMLRQSHRCQNPRLLRFSSTLFYNAEVKSSEKAEYFKLPFAERRKIYPSATLRFFDTSGLPPEARGERLAFDGNKPGLENPVEAKLCCEIFYRLLKKHPLSEITIIAPYRRQVRLLRKMLSRGTAGKAMGRFLDEEEWRNFVFSRISTVDSFQGGESDAVIISYVRSNDGEGIGFIDDPNRINVAHTRCRKELAVVGDLACLKKQARNKIFDRLERAMERDGVIIPVTTEMLEEAASRYQQTAARPSTEKKTPPRPGRSHREPRGQRRDKRAGNA